MNTLYFGDNLNVLRDHIKSESVDLIYLDPPFNSDRNYGHIFEDNEGIAPSSQITAFKDTWEWGPQAVDEFNEVVRMAHHSNTHVAALLQSFEGFLGHNNMLAYLTFMANRLLEMHRALKPTGTLYLHCDPTASHYLKLLLDAILGHKQFKNEIIWSYRRWPAKTRNFQSMHDVIHRYSKGNTWTWNQIYEPLAESTLKQWGDGKQNAVFDEAGNRVRSSSTEEKSPGLPLRDVWDMSIIAPRSHERLGYPTQKPLSLLERIITASSNEGDVVLDPFCGCGTAVHAAHKLKRNWIGIDITHFAVSLIENRLRDAFDEKMPIRVIGVPTTADEAESLATMSQKDARYQFQWWAVSLAGARPYEDQRKGADGGVDGILMFTDELDKHKKAILQVKSSKKDSVDAIKKLIATLPEQKAEVGLFISLAEPTKPMVKAALDAGYYDSPLRRVRKIQILTIRQLFEGHKFDIPDMAGGKLNRKQAVKEARRDPGDKQGRLL